MVHVIVYMNTVYRKNIAHISFQFSNIPLSSAVNLLLGEFKLKICYL